MIGIMNQIHGVSASGVDESLYLFSVFFLTLEERRLCILVGTFRLVLLVENWALLKSLEMDVSGGLPEQILAFYVFSGCVM